MNNIALFNDPSIGRAVSVSASTLESLLPYQLDDKTFAAFKETFHPRKRQFNKPFIDLISREAYDAAYLNAVFYALRDGFRIIGVYADTEQTKLVEIISSLVTSRLEEALKNTGDLEKHVVAFMQKLRKNRNHIVIPSERYNGGFDVRYVGIPVSSAGPLLNPNHRQDYALSSDTDENSYDVVRQNKIAATEVGAAILEICTAIQHGLLDQSTSELTSTIKRVTQVHPVKFNMHSILLKAFTSGKAAKIGLKISLPTYTPPELSEIAYLDPNFQILLVREPDSTALVRQTRSKDKPVELLNVSTMNILTAPSIGFSIAINLPKEYACFISQSEKPSLSAIHTWVSAWTASMLKPPGVKDGGLKPHRIPMYVFSPSKADLLVKKRKELGLYVEPGRVNEDGLYITSGGDLAFLPTQDNNSNANALAYEEAMEKALEVSFKAGAPLSIDHAGETSPVFGLDKDYAASIRELKLNLHKFAGGIQAYSWDLNAVVSVSNAEPDKLVSTKLVGGQRPDELNLSHYMKVPFSTAVTKMISGCLETESNSKIKPVDLTLFGIFKTTAMAEMAKVFTFMIAEKKIPDVQSLLASAMKDLGVTSAEDEKVAAFEMRTNGATIYKTKPDFTDPELTVPETAGQLILRFLMGAYIDAAGHAGSNLSRYCAINNEEITEDPHYFDADASSLGEFSNLYNYIGGRVFYHALKALLSIPHKDWLTTIVGKDHPFTLPTFTRISTEVYPLAVMLGKYVPEKREEIYEKAEKIATSNKEAQFSEEEVHFPGSIAPKGDNPGMQMFPHQAETASRLRSHPRFAFLDIAPGGGKTALGLIDIGMLYHEKLIKRPVIVCPNKLVANWIEDLHKFTGGRWNAIPITTQTYAEWGDDRLTALIKDAPANTILIVGSSFLSNTPKQQLILGNCVERVSNSLEFLKKFSPDYLLIDEAHRIRNPSSSIHQAAKSISTMTSVKYVRLATGTMIQNVLSDVVGQCAMFNGQIFRSKDEFDEDNKGVVAEINGKKVVDYKSDTPSKAKRLMAEFCTIVSYKRKEWAFMLPTPIETFISVKLEDESKDDPMGRAHKMFYQAVLTKTLEELRQNKMINKLVKGGSADEEEDDEDQAGPDKASQSSQTSTTATGKKIEVSEVEEEEENLDALEAALQPYLQRLERILTDPFGDSDLVEVAKAHFGPGVDRDTFIPSKLRKIYERISKHFTPIEWVKGMKVRAGDMCDHLGESYIYMPEEPYGSNEGVSNKAPSETSEDWKPQTRGKILIFCRYTRTVDAIFHHMPKEFKAKAVRFHGEVKNADENLSKFKKDPKVQILVANEMGISEGHNLQMASRFIRVEAPWAPGELDQSMSRIFRPDVGGEFKRSSIFLDWIICDGTLEVAKMGRLISKMLRKAQFDELDNPSYFKNLNPRDLPLIRMSLVNIEQLDSMNDLCNLDGSGNIRDVHEDSYIGQYQYLVSEQANEFREMRKTKRATMIPIEPTPMPEDAKILEFTPWIPNLRVPDRNNEGLVALSAQLQEEEDELTKAIMKDKNTLVGIPVRTEFGLGLIRSVTGRRSKNEAGEAGDMNISKVEVDLAQGGTVSISASKVYLATKVLPKDVGGLNKKAPKITEADKKRTARNSAKLDRAVQSEERAAARLRKASEKVTAPKRTPAPVVEEQLAVELHPVVYNGYLALEAITEKEEDAWLKKYGFAKFGAYAYINVPNLKTFESIHNYLDAKFTLQTKTTNLLNNLYDSFASGRGRKFDVELAPLSSFPMFYKTRHQLTKVENTRKPELKLYPVILNGMLILVVDLATNPVIRKHLGKVIPGCTAKFAVADGLDIIFPHSKRDLIAKVKEMKSAGVNITNMDELKEEVAGLDFKQVVSK